MNATPIKGKVIPRTNKNNVRKFTQAYKLKMLEKGSRCKNVAELNALLRREKLHSAQLAKWWREFSHRVSFEQTFLKQEQSKTVPHDQNMGSHSSESDETTINPREILQKIWRRKWLMLSTILLSMILAFLFIKSVTPSYTSKALVMIGNRNVDLAFKGVVPSLQVDKGTMQNELEIIRSYSIAERVIKKLDLDQYPEFNPQLREPGKFSKLLYKLKLKKDDVSEPLTQPDNFIPYENLPIIESFLENQKVALVGESRVIELSFSSHDPNLAATIANSILEHYLNDQIENKFSATNKTNTWLNKRVDDLRQKVENAETRVEEFRKTKGLLRSSQGITFNSQQLSELNTQLILAGTNRTEKEARLRQIQKLAGRDAESASEVMGSELIRNLREQESTLEGSLAEFSTSYGPKHPLIVNTIAEKNEIQNKISKEIKKIIIGLKNEANIARLRESKLKSRLAEIENKLVGSNKQEVQLRALEREAEATRNLLNTFLSRSKETGEQTNLDMQQPDAKIISYATPARKPSFPKKVPILALALFGSILLGLLSIFIRELFERGFRSGEQLEKETGLPSFGLVPKLGKFRSKFRNPEMYVQKFPASSLSESIRAVYSNMFPGKNDDRSTTKVIQFTSAYPDEGKSTLAHSLAILKRQAGMKTIIIDADMRSPSLHSAFKVRAQPGLAEYLSGNAAVHQVITQHKDSGVYIITAGHAKKSPTDLLPTERMDRLILELTEVFDLVIIDSPPVLAVPDAKILSSKVDLTAFVVKWADTRTKVVHFALKQLSKSGASQIGTILSMVDAKKHAKYSFADSGVYVGKFKPYYIGG